MASNDTNGKLIRSNSVAAENAVAHGLTAERVLAAEQEEYETLRQELEEQYSPKDRYQAELITRLARLIVRSRRAEDLEKRVFSECWGGEDGFDPRRFVAFVATFHRYDMEISRAIIKTQHELARATGEAGGLVTVDFNW
jgi:hypothetical protein